MAKIENIQKIEKYEGQFQIFIIFELCQNVIPQKKHFSYRIQFQIEKVLFVLQKKKNQIFLFFSKSMLTCYLQLYISQIVCKEI